MRINTAYTLFGLLSVCLAGAVITSCRGIEPITPSTGNEVTGGSEAGEVKGFFLLNEGNMGSNKATLDYFDYATGVYTRNIFAERNPGVALELGDVGNDLGIYGGRLYAVINCSNLVEVMDVETARHIAEIPLPNCRYIAFDGGYAYVSSYAGAVEFDPEYRRGYVAKIDTVTMQVVATCGVGYQPEEMAVVDGRLYVANSGGYMAPDYDLTVSVIDLATFEVCNEIEVAPNLHQVKIGGDGMLYISSRGDYYGHQSSTWVVDPSTDEVVRELQLLQNSQCLPGLQHRLRRLRHPGGHHRHPQLRHRRHGRGNHHPLLHRRQPLQRGYLPDRRQGPRHPRPHPLLRAGRRPEVVGHHR